MKTASSGICCHAAPSFGVAEEVYAGPRPRADALCARPEEQPSGGARVNLTDENGRREVLPHCRGAPCLLPPGVLDGPLLAGRLRSVRRNTEPTTAERVPHLRVHTHFSFGIGVSSPEVLAAAAAERGFAELACTDTNGVYGAVEFQRACEAAGVRPILGAHLVTETEETVALATDERGWAALCRAITH